MSLPFRFAHELYQSLGFDWVFLFMHATIHTETVVRALRILVQLLADSQLKQHFLNGDIFGGWVKGFDTISIEMTNLVVKSLTYLNPFQPPSQQIPGPIILAHLLPHHSDLSQIYLLLSANLLGQQCTDIPFNARFDMETLEEVFSIGDLRVMAEYRISGDAAGILLTVARTLLHKDPTDRQLQENAVNLIKFFERLYKSVAEFRRLAATQDFIEALVATLFPPPTYQDGAVSVNDGDTATGEGSKGANPSGEDWIMIDSDVLPGTGGKEEGDAILTRQSNLAVCTILKLLRTIAIDGFSSAIPMTKDTPPSCPILERVLSSTPPGIGPRLARQYQTSILQNMMDYLQSGNEDVMVLFREGVLGANLERALCGLSVFCTRTVDKVWQQCFLNPTQSVYTFLYWLLEQARVVPKQMPLMDLQRSLNRLILYEVSHIPSSEGEQRSFMEMLCLYSSQAHVIFDETNIEDRFLECLTYCLLKIALYEKFLAKNPLLSKMENRKISVGVDTSSLHGNLPSGYVPGSLAMMKSGANRLWTKMLEYKKVDLERLLHVELPSPGDNHRDTLVGHLPPHHLPGMGNKTFLKLQNCHLFLTDNLERTWKDFLSEEKQTQAQDSVQREMSSVATPITTAANTLKKGLVATMASRVRRKKGTAINKHDLVHEFVTVLSHLLILSSQKFYELLLRKHQRTVEYRLRFAASEWSKIEYELTRERGLWGPDKPSSLDKWMVDIVEGPCRMRKRMQRNHDFYWQYPYLPHLPKALKTKYQKPSSLDSELHAKREKLFQRPTILATPTHVTSETRGTEAVAKAADTLAGTQPSQALGPSYSSNKLDVFNHPDSDDPVAQTLYKMIEPDDKVTRQYQCARLTGLDSCDGVLLLGTTHFYVIEGITITRSGDIIDIETAPRDSYDPVVPGSIHTHSENYGKSQVPIQCIKWGYDTIREVHKRRYLLRHCAIEVFSSDGRSHFLIFHPKYRDKIYQRLLSLSKSSLTQGDSQYIAGIHPEMDPEHSQGIFSVLTGERSLVEKWVNGEMSNFQYLMHLNTLAGRSYNDLMQYPIFPWILADYSSETLDLNNPKIFRDLSKPMGAQSESRLQRFIERYKYFEDPTGENTPPYYYGTHYSSAMIVASYLIRMEPFSQYFLKLQGGHFDLPDRLFHSIPDAWKSASETNMADIKELIPEFFYLPEFLTNSNNFELGVKQSGEVLGSIILPPWSKGDPQEFVRVHREALECDYVSSNLHKWIDLIFGYKQKGEEALANHNVFHHLFYEGTVDIDKIEDPMKRNAAISFIHNFGQTPKQLFKKPHRQRKIASAAVSQDTPTPPPTNLMDSRRVFYKNLVQLMPSKEPVKIISGEVSQIVCPSDNRFPMAVDKNKIFLPWANYRYYFVWGFPDHSARIASVDTDKIISVFEGLHQGRILCAAIADDTTLLTGGESTVVCVWEVSHSGGKERVPAQLHLRQTLHGHTAAVSCLTTSPSYNLIISGSKDKTCILWDMTNFSFVRQLCDHSGPVTVVTINQLNGNIVSCTKNQIRLWTVNGTLLAETPLIMSSNVKILCCAVSELFDWDKENVIVTGSSDGIVRMWSLEYVSEEMMVKRRGSPADSMLSGVSGGESTLDFTTPRDRLASNVINKLKKSTLSSRSRSKSTPDRTDQLLGEKSQEEMFRSTGQMSKLPPTELPLDNDVDFDLQKQRASTPDGRGREEEVEVSGALQKKTVLRTFSQDEEEEKTAGSGTDLLSEGMYYPSGANEEAMPPPASPQKDYSARDDVQFGIAQSSDDFLTADGANSSKESMDVDQHVSCDQTLESCDVAKEEEEERGAELSAGGKEGEGEKSKMDKMAEVNPTYAKYLAEKRKESDELKQRTGKWVRRLKLVHTLTMHTSIHRKDNEKPCSVTSICISKDHRRLFIGDALGRIFSWTVSDNLGGVMQHWVLDHAVFNCYKCGVEFTFTERKHHCRDCGQIFCARCSNYETEVERLRIYKKVRVCANCYETITLEKCKQIFRAPSDIDV